MAESAVVWCLFVVFLLALVLPQWSWRSASCAYILALLQLHIRFTNAGFNIYQKHDGVNVMQDRKGFVGWMGLGGSAMQFHPDLEIGFGYCMTEMAQLMDANSRSWWLQEALLQCVD